MIPPKDFSTASPSASTDAPVTVDDAPAIAMVGVTDNIGRKALEMRSEKKTSTSPEKKPRKETPGEFEPAFANLKQACTTAKIHLHKRDMTYVQPCIDALSNLYLVKHTRENANINFMASYEKEISVVIQSVFNVLSSSPEELSAQTERDLVGVVFEMTEPRYMNLNAFVSFCCNGKLPSFKGEPGQAFAKVLHKLAVQFTTQASNGWTLDMVVKQLKDNFGIIDENFIRTFSEKEHKDEFDVLFLATALQCTFIHNKTTRISLFQSWITYFKLLLQKDVEFFVKISLRFFDAVRHESHLNYCFFAIYIGPIIRDLDAQMPMEQLLPILKLLVWLLGETSLPSYCQNTVETIIDRLLASDLREEDYLSGMKLLTQRYINRHVTVLSDGTIARASSLCNKFKNLFRTFPYLENLAIHDRFFLLWNHLEAYFLQALNQFQGADGIGVYTVILSSLVNIQGIDEKICFPEAGQTALMHFIQTRFLHLQSASSEIFGIELMTCARNLSPERFKVMMRKLALMNIPKVITPTPQICTLHHSDAELLALVQSVLGQLNSRKIYLTILHYLVVHQGFTVSIQLHDLLLEILCEKLNQLWKLDALMTFFQFPEVRDSNQARLFFEQIVKNRSENCDPIIVLGKLAKQNLLPREYGDIVIGLLKTLPLTPGTLETTSLVFEALGWISLSQVSPIHLDKELLTKLFPLIIQGGTGQPYPFTALQKLRTDFGIRVLAINNIIPQSWIEFLDS